MTDVYEDFLNRGRSGPLSKIPVPGGGLGGGDPYDAFLLRGPLGQLITRGSKGRAADVQDLRERGVDVESGASVGARVEFSLTPPEREHEALTQMFPEGFYRSPAGLVVKSRQPDGTVKETLFDESGFSVKDLSDMAGAAPNIIGSVAGAAAAMAAFPALATGGVFSLGAIAVAAGVGEVIGGSAADVVQALRTGGVDQDFLLSMIERQGLTATIDTIAGFLLAGGYRAIKGGGQFIVGPNARRMAESPQPEINAAAERLGVTLTPGVMTGSPTLLQAEAVASKIPGAREVFERLRKAETAQLGAAQERLVAGRVTSAKAGEAISAELTAQKQAAQKEIDSLRLQIGKILSEHGRRFEESLAARPFSTTEAGEMARTGIIEKWTRNKETQKLLEDAAQDQISFIPIADPSFGGAGAIRAESARLIKQFPKQKWVESVDTGLVDKYGKAITRQIAKNETIPEYMPGVLKSFLGAAKKLPDKMTVEELRNLRKVVNDAIDEGELFPGVSTSNLKAMAKAITSEIKDARANAPTKEIGDLLEAASEHYRKNRPKFEMKPVLRAMRPEGKIGAIDSDQVLPDLLLKNKFEDAARVMDVLGEKSPAVQAARRSVWDEMVHGSRDTLLGEGAIDPKLLAKNYDKLRDETKILVFGEDRKTVEDLIRGLAANKRIIDLPDGQPGTIKISAMLKDAINKEAQLMADFENTLLKPIIRGEVGATAMNPELFVRHAMSEQIPFSDLQKLWGRLPELQREMFRGRLVTEILERSAKRASDPLDRVTAAVAEKTLVGDELLATLAKDFGQSASESLAKIRFILGEDTVKILHDVGVVEGARAHGQSVAKAAGGLVGGSILANFLGMKLGDVGRLIKFKIVANLMKSAVVRKWLTSGIKLPANSPRGTIALIVGPQVLAAAAQELGEESETAQDIADFFVKAGGQ